jgi:glycerol-3-phosphate dehydrogenase
MLLPLHPCPTLVSICKQLIGKVKPGAMAISLIKGMRVRPEGPQLISQMVERYLGIDCSVLMGANIAGDIAAEQVGGRCVWQSRAAQLVLSIRLFMTACAHL